MMDQQISLLMTTGLLTRNVAARDSYLFAVPGAGRLVTSIAKGRKVPCPPHPHHSLPPKKTRNLQEG